MIENWAPWMDVVIVAIVTAVTWPALLRWGRRIDRRRGVPARAGRQPSHVRLVEPDRPAHVLPWPLDRPWEELHRADSEGEVVQ